MAQVLAGNKLRALPASVAELSRLALLDVSHNRLVGLPDGVSRLASLRQLLVSHNQLPSLPTELEHTPLR